MCLYCHFEYLYLTVKTFSCLLIIRVFDVVQRAITQNVTYSEKAKELKDIKHTQKKVTLVVWMSQ